MGEVGDWLNNLAGQLIWKAFLRQYSVSLSNMLWLAVQADVFQHHLASSASAIASRLCNLAKKL